MSEVHSLCNYGVDEGASLVRRAEKRERELVSKLLLFLGPLVLALFWHTYFSHPYCILKYG